MDARSLQDVNREFFSKRQRSRKLPKYANDAVFWISVAIVIVAVLSFNYNSFLTRPVFGYSLYLTEGDKNLMLVKNADDFDPSLTAETIYQNGSNLTAGGICGNNHQTVEIGIVKANFPILGKLFSFIINKAYIPFIAAVAWLAMTLFMGAKKRTAGHGANRFSHDLHEKEVRE